MLSRSLKLAVLGLALLAGGCDRQSSDPAQQQPAPVAEAAPQKLDRSHKGEQIPALTLKDASGNEVALAGFTGKPVLLNLWATWCAPCVTELPTLEELAATPDANLQVVTVSQDMREPDEIAGFLKERGFEHLPTILDPEGDLAMHYKVSTLPTTILYDAQGKEVWRYTGGNEWTSPEARALIGEAG